MSEIGGSGNDVIDFSTSKISILLNINFQVSRIEILKGEVTAPKWGVIALVAPSPYPIPGAPTTTTNDNGAS